MLVLLKETKTVGDTKSTNLYRKLFWLGSFLFSSYISRRICHGRVCKVMLRRWKMLKRRKLFRTEETAWAIRLTGCYHSTLGSLVPAEVHTARGKHIPHGYTQIPHHIRSSAASQHKRHTCRDALICRHTAHHERALTHRCIHAHAHTSYLYTFGVEGGVKSTLLAFLTCSNTCA